MKTFLQQIAETYYEKFGDQMADFCYIFPNKRCCIFFENYVTKVCKSRENAHLILPFTIDINSFIMKLSRSVEIPRIEQIFILYDCYKNLIAKKSNGNQIVNFDTFSRWGELAIDDFNDIDKFLADAKSVLTNTQNLKEIKTDYLTDEQLEVVNTYFRDPVKEMIDNDHMWKHYRGDAEKLGRKEITKSYYDLWDVLYDLYNSFREALQMRDVCYTGMAYRDVAENLDKYAKRLNHKQYVFIGFNALSKSEQALFSWMQEHKNADNETFGDFYWDSESKFFTDSNPAVKFVSHFKKIYKSKITIEFDGKENIPQATIVGVPSRVGQTKFAANKLTELFENKLASNSNVNTAVVLPDEILCTYLLRSFADGVLSSNVTPNDVDDKIKINITMGYSMANTPVTSLIKAIIKMEHRAKKTAEDYTYFYTDVLELLSHPLLHKIKPKSAKVLSDIVNVEHQFNISRKEILSRCPDLEYYFPVFEDTNPEITFSIIKNLLNDFEKQTVNDSFLDSFVKSYKQSLDIVYRLCLNYEINLNHDTLTMLLHRLASGETVNFAGEPLCGAQIMGVLETRALDFENVIVLSMNEKVYPKKMFHKSLIPYQIRVREGITTPDIQESIFAYYFYRLLTRAKRVFFVYDSRTGNGKSEQSRYIYQIKNIFGSTFKQNLSEMQYSFDFSQPARRVFSVPKIAELNGKKYIEKTNEIIKRLKQFTPGGQSNFSASALSKYIQCPLSFFFEYILGFREENEPLPFVDDSMYGTIMHAGFQNFYENCRTILKLTTFTTDTIKSILYKHHDIIEHSLVSAFFTNYYPNRFRPTDRLLKKEDIPSELQLLAEFMISFMDRVLKREIEHFETYGIKQYEYLGSETKFSGEFKLKNGESINLKGYIDRLDKVTFNNGNTAIRIIDYKTGTDETEFSGVENLVNYNGKKYPKAIFQLFLYCKAYTYFVDKEYTGPIIPLIYKVRTMAIEGVNYLTDKNGVDESGKKKTVDVTDFTPYADSFYEVFSDKISEIFNPDTPFSQAENNSACKYCRFTSICGVNPDEIY